MLDFIIKMHYTKQILLKYLLLQIVNYINKLLNFNNDIILFFFLKKKTR